MYQSLLGAEMIVDGGQIHPGAARDLAQRGRVKTLLSKQAFSGVEDLVAGVYRQFKRSIETSVLNATPCGSVWQADIVPEKSDAAGFAGNLFGGAYPAGVGNNHRASGIVAGLRADVDGDVGSVGHARRREAHAPASGGMHDQTAAVVCFNEQNNLSVLWLARFVRIDKCRPAIAPQNVVGAAGTVGGGTNSDKCFA